MNIALITRLEDRDARIWYAASAIANGWSRKVLETQIATDLRARQGGALTSFDRALPAPDSEMVRDAIKDPYNFEFLGMSTRARERDLEQALLNDIQSFLMEMGRGFALVGRQFPLRVVDEETGEEDEFFVDLLFYNYPDAARKHPSGFSFIQNQDRKADPVPPVVVKRDPSCRP